MKNIYLREGLFTIKRPGKDSCGVGNQGNLTREMAVKTGNIVPNRKRRRYE